MKYFIDTEFLEGTQNKTIFGIKYDETKPTIDLISIGIVAEDGREYYAISKDFNLKEAWNRFQYDENYTYILDKNGNKIQPKIYWIRENILKPIYNDLIKKSNIYGDERNYWSFSYFSLKKLLKLYAKSNKQIAEEVYNFCSNDYHKGNNLPFYLRKQYDLYDNFRPEFYGYYSNYDWVVFCWLFGKMIDLPKGFPMYCIDLKQILDEKANALSSFELSKLAHTDVVKHNVYSTYDTGVLECTKTDLLKNALNYPKQTNEHNALADARWNYELYKFLNKL